MRKRSSWRLILGAILMTLTLALFAGCEQDQELPTGPGDVGGSGWDFYDVSPIPEGTEGPLRVREKIRFEYSYRFELYFYWGDRTMFNRIQGAFNEDCPNCERYPDERDFFIQGPINHGQSDIVSYNGQTLRFYAYREYAYNGEGEITAVDVWTDVYWRHNNCWDGDNAYKAASPSPIAFSLEQSISENMPWENEPDGTRLGDEFDSAIQMDASLDSEWVLVKRSPVQRFYRPGYEPNAGE